MYFDCICVDLGRTVHDCHEHYREPVTVTAEDVLSRARESE